MKMRFGFQRGLDWKRILMLKQSQSQNWTKDATNLINLESVLVTNQQSRKTRVLAQKPADIKST